MRAALLGVMLVALLIVSSTYGGRDIDPRLAFVSYEPVVVAGSGFRSYERIRVLVSPGPVTRTIRAGRLGRFRVTVRTSFPRCGGLVVQALGSRGSRAMIDRAGIDCAPIDSAP
jgi:hypothetical protein